MDFSDDELTAALAAGDDEKLAELRFQVRRYLYSDYDSYFAMRLKWNAVIAKAILMPGEDIRRQQFLLDLMI